MRESSKFKKLSVYSLESICNKLILMSLTIKIVFFSFLSFFDRVLVRYSKN